MLTQLRSQVGSAGSLAERVEHDVEMAREPMSDLQTAAAVQALTLDDMTAALAELDLSRAAVLMNGPAAEVKAAFDVLGRRPVYLQSTGTKPEREAAPAPAPAAFASAEQHVRYADVKASLTAQPPFPEHLLMIAPGVSRAVIGDGASNVQLTGYSLGAGLGYRYGWFSAVGAYVGVGMLEGSVRLVPSTSSASCTSTTSPQPRRNGERAPSTASGGGIDLARFGTHHIGIGLRWETTTRSATEYSSLSLGLVYRR